MKLTITGDYYVKSGLDIYFEKLNKSEYWMFFEPKNYGIDLESIGIVLICHEKKLQSTINKRVRMYKKEKLLVFDVFINFEKIKNIDSNNKIILITNGIIDELKYVMPKYKKLDFDSKKFMEDFTAFALNTGFLLEK